VVIAFLSAGLAVSINSSIPALTADVPHMPAAKFYRPAISSFVSHGEVFASPKCRARP